MKRVNLPLVLLLVLVTATMLLHASSYQENQIKAAELKSLPPIIAPTRKDNMAKRASATRVNTPSLPTPTPATQLIAHASITPHASAPAQYIEPNTGMEFLPVPGGCFQMGDNNGDIDEKPAHHVCLDTYFIGKFEVTQGQWLKLMGTSPSFFSSCGDNCPVESISWHEAQGFITTLNKLNGRTYRLLTEAEWEYACRSGGKSERYCGGDDVNTAAWFDKNSSSQPHPVGDKQPNDLGIYDMSGNVWEWVADYYQKNYYSTAPPNNPAGPSTGAKRVIRGGSWYNDPKNVRALIRGGDEPDHRSINLGFRIAYSAK